LSQKKIGRPKRKGPRQGPSRNGKISSESAVGAEGSRPEGRPITHSRGSAGKSPSQHELILRKEMKGKCRDGCKGKSSRVGALRSPGHRDLSGKGTFLKKNGEGNRRKKGAKKTGKKLAAIPKPVVCSRARDAKGREESG